MKAFTAILALSAMVPAGAADFRSIADNGAVMYDAPSVRAKKLFVASRYTPVEIVVSIEGWAKVRDPSGDLTWVEKKALSELRTVVVTAPAAGAKKTPDEQSPAAFGVKQGVALELIELSGGGWVKVRHRDGQSGFLRVSEVWGH